MLKYQTKSGKKSIGWKTINRQKIERYTQLECNDLNKITSTTLLYPNAVPKNRTEKKRKTNQNEVAFKGD